jgi:hypothetical protein
VIRRAGCCSREGPSRAAGTGTSVGELPRLGENGIGGLGPDEGFGAGLVFIMVGSGRRGRPVRRGRHTLFGAKAATAAGLGGSETVPSDRDYVVPIQKIYI